MNSKNKSPNKVSPSKNVGNFELDDAARPTTHLKEEKLAVEIVDSADESSSSGEEQCLFVVPQQHGGEYFRHAKSRNSGLESGRREEEVRLKSELYSNQNEEIEFQNSAQQRVALRHNSKNES
jgi:hypothetical protein